MLWIAHGSLTAGRILEVGGGGRDRAVLPGRYNPQWWTVKLLWPCVCTRVCVCVWEGERENAICRAAYNLNSAPYSASFADCFLHLWGIDLDVSLFILTPPPPTPSSPWSPVLPNRPKKSPLPMQLLSFNCTKQQIRVIPSRVPTYCGEPCPPAFVGCKVGAGVRSGFPGPCLMISAVGSPWTSIVVPGYRCLFVSLRMMPVFISFFLTLVLGWFPRSKKTYLSPPWYLKTGISFHWFGFVVF